MEFERDDISEFGSKLASLGGRLGFEKYPSDKYIDIEEFFLDATRFVFVDQRLARCIEHWVRTYGFLIGPSKVKKLIEKKSYIYDSAVLGVFLKLISRTKEKQLSLKPLEKFCAPKKELTFRSKGKVRVDVEDFDRDWLCFNIATNKFYDESIKNLLDFDFVLKGSPELKNRIESDDVLCADYKSFIQREGLDHSLYYICKRIHGHYSNLHKLHTRFTKFNIHQKLQKSA